MKIQVTIFPRKGVRDPQGEAVLDKLRRLDWLDTPVNSVAMGRIILLEVEEENSQAVTESVARMCREFLANEIVEDYKISYPED